MSDDKDILEMSAVDSDIRNILITHSREKGTDPSFLFELLEGIIKNEQWKTMKDKDGNPVGSLRRLIEAPPPVGAGMSLKRLKKLLELPHRHEEKSSKYRERMKKLRIRINQEIPDIGEHGGDRKSNEHENQFKNLKLISGDGPTKDYKLARMKKEAKSEKHTEEERQQISTLLDQAISEEISVNKAYTQAGFSPVRRAINMENAESALGTIIKHMRPDVLHELTDLLIKQRIDSNN